MASETSVVSHGRNPQRRLTMDVSLETGNFATPSDAVEDWLAEKFPNAVDLKSRKKSKKMLPPRFAKRAYNKDQVSSLEVQSSTGEERVKHGKHLPVTHKQGAGMQDHSQSAGIKDIFTNVGYFEADEAVRAWLDKNFPEGRVH